MTERPLVREDALQTALEWMKKHPVVDGLAAAVTSERAMQNCIDGGLNAVAGGGGGRTAKEALMSMLNMRWLVKRIPDKITLVTTVDGIEQAREDGKVALFVNWQNADPLEDDYHWLEIFYEYGLRVLNFCYNGENRLGYGCLEPHDLGIKRFGIDILQDCNRLGILLDGSHSGERTTLDMIEMSTAPCIFSHSNPKGVRMNHRNISDTQITECATRGGVIGCPLYSDFVADTSEGQQPTLDDWVKCVDYVVNLAGIDHVAIGTDIYANPGGAVWWDNNTGRRYRDVSGGMTFEMHEVEGINFSHANFPLLIASLVQRGYKEEDVAKIMGGNWLRVYRQVWGN